MFIIVCTQACVCVCDFEQVRGHVRIRSHKISLFFFSTGHCYWSRIIAYILTSHISRCSDIQCNRLWITHTRISLPRCHAVCAACVCTIFMVIHRVWFDPARTTHTRTNVRVYLRLLLVACVCGYGYYFDIHVSTHTSKVVVQLHSYTHTHAHKLTENSIVMHNTTRRDAIRAAILQRNPRPSTHEVFLLVAWMGIS